MTLMQPYMDLGPNKRRTLQYQSNISQELNGTYHELSAHTYRRDCFYRYRDVQI